MRLKLTRATLMLAVLTLPTQSMAIDIGKALRDGPAASRSSKRALLDVERCLVMSLDTQGNPIVYRTPDKPDESLIYYSVVGGSPAIIQLERNGGSLLVLFYKGAKSYLDQSLQCF
ncbi:MAG: hypothetical protein EOO38_32845 [Cytophagaceae bacterium]|nr:MAG: hypothetical protein EOO38_32845 [Cytophagaceae bacterium]